MSDTPTTPSSQSGNAWTRLDAKLDASKGRELWKFVKFSIAGQLSSLVELLVAYLLQYVIFKSIYNAPIQASPGVMKFLELIKMTEGQGALYTYIISITIGYAIAFVLNRKVSFKADSNVALSTFLYVLMVIFTIIAGAWIGVSLNAWLLNIGKESLQWLVKPVQMLIPTLWTYPLNRFVIHRQHKAPAAENPPADLAEEVAE
ncbi:MAG: GtrA family protein [Oscillospiraceae bacterium]|jgi:putative flippase GtrA|nr:GtrA family protein [Oscillospiraceae bacterium]